MSVSQNTVVKSLHHPASRSVGERETKGAGGTVQTHVRERMISQSIVRVAGWPICSKEIILISLTYILKVILYL